MGFEKRPIFIIFFNIYKYTNRKRFRNRCIEKEGNYMKNKMDLIKNFDKLRMAHFLSDIRKHPENYPQNTMDWLDYLGESVKNTPYIFEKDEKESSETDNNEKESMKELNSDSERDL